MKKINIIKERERLQDRIDAGYDREYFAQFGEKYCVAENAMRYERLMACGYPAEQALTFDKYGWIVDHYPFKEGFRKESVARTPEGEITLLTFQLPNGEWIAGNECHAQTLHWYSGPTIYGETFTSEDYARRAELKHIIKYIEDGWEDEPKVLLPQLKKAASEALQLSLFGN